MIKKYNDVGIKKHFESYPWFHDELFIEEVEYEGIPLKACKSYCGKDVIDEEHYFGLDACEVGDYFSEKLINDIMNMMPPACMRSDCSQLGEPISHKIDKDGNYRATYATFKRIVDGIWEYCGDCFLGETKQHGTDICLV